ncbi:MAG: TetR/AcrR family transcriptional regulator [Cytophagales bacterium]|nr:TetR/AcrR family transcriptional regulator [Cytophagales bacterium]
MKRTTRNATRTRQEIIEKAAPVFNVHGLAGTSMQMLVEATGFQMGGIYRHFETKKALAKEVFQYSYDVLIQQNLDLLEEATDPREKLMHIVGAYESMVKMPKVKGGCPILNMSIEVDDTDREFRELVKANFSKIINVIISTLEQGKSTGAFQQNIEPSEVALFMASVLEGSIMIGKLTRDPMAVLSAFRQMKQYLKVCVLIRH